MKKNIERRTRFGNNRKFEEDPCKLFNEKVCHNGEVPDIEEFVGFWGGIWEKEEETPDKP